MALLSFNLHDSDLPLQPAFPILIYNLVNWFLPPPVPGNGQIAPGTPVTIQAWPGTERITITAPGQQPATVAPPFPATAFNQTNQAGIYYVAQYTRDQERNGAFAINLFDPLQSRLAPAAALPVAHSTPFDSGGTTVPRALREIWPWIAAFLLLVLCAEWWLFSRSYTMRGVSAGAINLSLSGTKDRAPTAIANVQNQVAARYRIIRKRVTRMTKRLKGKSNAGI